MATYLRDGRAVKFIGGRGMGKSVLLQQLRTSFEQESDTRVVLVQGPTEEASVPALVHDIAWRLNLQPARASMNLVMEMLADQGVNRLIVLLDEIDQYVLLDGGTLARTWLNHLEVLRKTWMDRFSIVVAGGLGLLHVSHVLGSGLVSRAESCIARTFDLDELRELAVPLARRGVIVDEPVLQTLAALSGGNPALATYGFAAIWDAGDATPRLLQDVYAEFPSSHRDFVTAVENGVSHRGLVGAPGRVLELVRQSAGALPQAELRQACAGDEPPVDVPQALQLLEAAGLLQVHGLAISDPVQVYPVSSVLNMPSLKHVPADPIERLIEAVSMILGVMHRFGRDFHGEKDLLQEQVFSSVLAVGLALLGWQEVDRELVQSAGFLDLRIRLRQAGTKGHIVLETKIWLRNDYQDIQQQIDDYRVSDTLHGVAVMLGKRKTHGWAEEYERKCLGSGAFTRMPTPSDLVGRWRVEHVDANGCTQITDHFLVQIPKRR
jgi:hypothetical protein